MLFRPFYHGPLKHLQMLVKDREYRRLCGVLSRYEPVPPRRETQVKVAGWDLLVPDVPSLLSAYRAIFRDRVYDFVPRNDPPRILDCGANIGLSVLYFKRRFPKARITAFEADPAIFKYLDRNLRTNGAADVDLVNKAVWSSETTLTFAPDGADAGRIDAARNDNAAASLHVPAVRLRPWLQQGPVDFLKMDIEGAEVQVILDCADLLGVVDNMYIEYHAMVGRPQRLGEMLQACERAGFRVYLDSSSRLPAPFRDGGVPMYSGMDLQLHVFCRRLK
jgi:FkbM family methyltransferase